MTNEEILKKNGGRRYDVCLMNPPYGSKGKTIANEFLNKVIEISDKVVSIQPPTFLINRKDTNRSLPHNEQRTLDLFDKYYTDIDIFTNSAFDIGISQQLCIFYVDKTRDHIIKFKNDFGYNEYDKCENINKFNNNEQILEFRKIVSKLCENENYLTKHINWTDPRNKQSVETRKNNDKSDLWFVNIPYIHGWPGTPECHTIVTKNTIPAQHNRGNHYINFETKEECQNFINYLKTDFVRMCVWLLKNDNALAYKTKLVPWFDFTDEHFSKTPREIDNWLFKKYNISDEIRKCIEEILPDYYEIRK